jgi:glycogen(starch) synthase
VILIDYRGRYANLDRDKFLLWQDHGISTSADDGEVNEVVAFGFATAEFFRAFTEVVRDRPVLAHFHEWMGGVAVPRIAHMRLPIATVFTTHATLLGRYLASDNPYFYDHLPYLNPDAEAAKYNIYPKFAIERAAGPRLDRVHDRQRRDGFEARKLLGRGRRDPAERLNIQRFAAPHEFQYLHCESSSGSTLRVGTSSPANRSTSTARCTVHRGRTSTATRVDLYIEALYR